MSSQGNAINGYVIMPNHLHLLLFYNGLSSSLNRLVGNGKRFIAYEIVKRLDLQEEDVILKTLSNSVNLKDRARKKLHEVWEPSFDVKRCRTENFILQKLNYIHNNPFAGKWKLADNIIDYVHSSASFYITGTSSFYPVIDYKNFIEFDEEGGWTY